MRRVMSKNVKLLESTVAKYNTVAILSSAAVAQIDLTDVSSGTFAWQAGPGIMFFSYYFFCLERVRNNSYNSNHYLTRTIFLGISIFIRFRYMYKVNKI